MKTERPDPMPVGGFGCTKPATSRRSDLPATRAWCQLSGLILLLVLPSGTPAAETNTETQLISILQSSGTFTEKNAACWELKRVGTAQSVPALGALLTNEQLSHSARYALESMPAPEAGLVLVRALEQAGGLNRVGIIQSLGARREAGAVEPLSKLLAQGDAVTAAAAATALGQIGGAQALGALQSAQRQLAGDATNAVRNAVFDGLLRCGQHLLASGDRQTALPIYESLYQEKTSGAVRLAAFRGIILSSDESAGLKAMTTALAGTDGPSQAAALALVRDFKATGATEKFAALLGQVQPTVQVALIGVLAQRGNAAAAPAIAAAAKSPDARVRSAALEALGALDDTSSTLLLAQAAATTAGDEQAAARQSLTLLHGGNPADAMLAAMQTAPPAVQAELARALGERSDTNAVPKLFELARQGPDSVRNSALQALARLVSPGQVAALVSLVVEAQTDAARASAAEALNTAFQRLQAKYGHVDTAPLAQALGTGSAASRAALMPVCSGLAEPQVRAALRAALGDRDTKVRSAALRALTDTTDPELAPDLLEAARTTPEENLRSLAIAGWIRLAIREQTGKVPLARQIDGLASILKTPLSVEQKRLLLSGLAEVAAPETLALAEGLLTEAPVRSEAARAIIAMSHSIPDSALAAAALKKVFASPQPADVLQAAQAALKEIEARAGYITTWKIAGPFRQADKDYAALFDIPFPPETDGTGDWRPIAPGTDPAQPYVLDLLKAIGGEQCVAYARTWVFSERATPARLELGSDDGVKVWLNRNLVHANNTARPITPGSDKVSVTLQAGWNLVLLKITQNNQGWSFCARFLGPDGGLIEGLKADASR